MRTFTKTAVMFFTLSMLTISVVIAQNNNPPANTTTTQATATFSEQERAEAKKQLQGVGELFGVKKPTSPEQTKTESKSTAKTEDKPVNMAEVASKALDMVGNAVGTIAGIVQKVAPEVWEIMVRQQYAAALAMLVGPFLFLLIVAVYVVVVKKYWKRYPDDTGYFDHSSDPTLKFFRALLTTFIPGIMAIIFSGVLAYRIGDALPMLINPKYYAVKDLLEMLLR
jgi:hypothetical protein